MEVEGRWTALHIRKNTSGANNISLAILEAIATLVDFPPGYCHFFSRRLFKSNGKSSYPAFATQCTRLPACMFNHNSVKHLGLGRNYGDNEV
jgi:hypothetical protein